MHAPAEFQLTVSRFGAWRGGLVASGVLAWATALAWWITTERPWVSVAAGFLLVSGVVATASLASLASVTAFVLRWDGVQWHLTGASQESSPGSLRVAVDAGRWLLLQFVPDRADGGRSGARWLPIQRSGLEVDWHRLRATLYTAIPAGPAALGEDLCA